MDKLTDKEKIKVLRTALQDASDHLDYCGYGDSWERECAIEEGLEKKITEALENTKEEAAKRGMTI